MSTAAAVRPCTDSQSSSYSLQDCDVKSREVTHSAQVNNTIQVVHPQTQHTYTLIHHSPGSQLWSFEIQIQYVSVKISSEIENSKPHTKHPTFKGSTKRSEQQK